MGKVSLWPGHRIYCKAILPSSGLGNRLFPWARCRLYSLKHGIPMLRLKWFQVKIGPLFRGESDLRFYHGLFRQDHEQMPHGERFVVNVFGQRVPEPDNLDWRPPAKNRPCVVVFEGERDHFGRLRGWHKLLHEQLIAITCDKWLANNSHIVTCPIGIHVRRGDFSTPESETELHTSGAVRTPLSWFIDSLRWLRKQMRETVGAFVVSDGTSGELEPLLAEPNVVRINSGSAVGDLLQLAKARVLIASGGSTFSAWACFLGHMPTISHPGQSLQWFKLGNERGVYVGEFDPRGVPPADFVGQVQAILRKEQGNLTPDCQP